ncbi:uncharacterized protein LOC141533639 [Cotesia typhae]|uniref:uncharacterized protein LOC141533639 n=1 Tax=Cotesia typhae TaxID=2053667 RepID=UPI003D68DA08
MNFKIIFLLTAILFVQINAMQKRPCKYGEVDTCALPATCDNPNPGPIQCVTTSCVCDKDRGFVLDERSGNCIKRSQCPKPYRKN